MLSNNWGFLHGKGHTMKPKSPAAHSARENQTSLTFTGWVAFCKVNSGSAKIGTIDIRTQTTVTRINIIKIDFGLKAITDEGEVTAMHYAML